MNSVQLTCRQPLVTSYDSGYEHSLEHWLDVQQLVEAVASTGSLDRAELEDGPMQLDLPKP